MASNESAFAAEAIRALGRRDVPSARTFIAQAFEADHKLGPLADAVFLACSEIEEKGEVSTGAWNTLGDAVGSSELFAVVEASRS